MTRNFCKVLLAATVLGAATLAGCASTDGDRSDRQTAHQPAAARKPATTQPETGQQSAGESIDDAVVTAKVKAKLIDDEVTKAYQIEVATFQGTVQLSGTVDSEEARSRATELAKDVGGVKGVKNSLQVRNSDG